MSAEISLRHRLGEFTLDVAFRFDDASGVTALFGPSGAGKSTIIAAIAGFLRPDEGRVVLGGETLFDSARKIAVPVRARRVGTMFQDARLFPHLDVKANLLYGWRRAREKATASEIDAIVALLGLDTFLARRPHTLSGGERSRVALGRALLMRPRALLLDEPLSALDTARKDEILPYLEKLVRETKIPMLYVSHALDEVARLANRMVVVDQGRVVAEGTLLDVTARLGLVSGRHILPGAILEAKIAAHDEAHGLSELILGNETLVVPHVHRALGDMVRIRIDAGDVMLALVRPEGISANNVLAATVKAIGEDGFNADVQLQLNGALLVSRITRRSLERLRLQPGTPVFALVKSVTVGGREPG